MKYVDEFRDRRLIERVAARIRATIKPGRTYTFMDVCGTHTMNIFKFGLRDILPWNIRLISGPGCPVCVTPNAFLDRAIALARCKNVIVATFGDMMRVPGSSSSLDAERAAGRAVKVVYSSLDALAMARAHPDREVVFLGVGFETTIPTVAASILTARREGIRNYSVLSGHKTMPPALHALVSSGELAIDGFILPGHVSAIIGERPYRFLCRRHGMRLAIAGFEPLDIMQAIAMLIAQKKPRLDVQYTRVISASGNAVARGVIGKVFRPVDAVWRGLGPIAASGLAIRERFSAFDAAKRFPVRPGRSREPRRCICGDVLRGARTPSECALFAKACTPVHPIGSCMVSSEGTCAAYYRYHRINHG